MLWPFKQLGTRAENAADYMSVAICFRDLCITELFSSLLEARGMKTEVLYEIEELKGNAKVITEPIFFEKLPKRYHDKCLVIGNTLPPGAPQTHHITRPLTEEKIEAALGELLRLN